jgi:hypothetical protein
VKPYDPASIELTQDETAPRTAPSPSGLLSLARLLLDAARRRLALQALTWRRGCLFVSPSSPARIARWKRTPAEEVAQEGADAWPDP